MMKLLFTVSSMTYLFSLPCRHDRDTLQNNYVTKTLSSIEDKRQLNYDEKIILKDTLKHIFIYLDSKNKQHLALFTTMALYNTEDFKQFKTQDSAFYSPRGLLKIAGIENYQTLSDISGLNFLAVPQKLETLERMVLCATVKYFHLKMGDKYNYTFAGIMKIFYLEDYTNFLQWGTKTLRWRKLEEIYGGLVNEL